MFPEDQIIELRKMCSVLYAAEEAGTAYIMLEGLILPDGTVPDKVDALLCPSPREGYTSRLYFSMKIQSLRYNELNWNANGIRIFEKTWYAYSWKINRSDLRLAQMVSDHLNAKKK